MCLYVLLVNPLNSSCFYLLNPLNPAFILAQISAHININTTKPEQVFKGGYYSNSVKVWHHALMSGMQTDT